MKFYEDLRELCFNDFVFLDEFVAYFRLKKEWIIQVQSEDSPLMRIFQIGKMYKLKESDYQSTL